MKMYLLERSLWEEFRRYPTRRGRGLGKSNSNYEKDWQQKDWKESFGKKITKVMRNILGC